MTIIKYSIYSYMAISKYSIYNYGIHNCSIYIAEVTDGFFSQAILPTIFSIRYFRDGVVFVMGTYYFEINQTISTIKAVDTRHEIVSSICIKTQELRYNMSEYRYPLRDCQRPWFQTRFPGYHRQPKFANVRFYILFSAFFNSFVCFVFVC